MKAAVCHEYGQPLTVDEVTLDAPQTGEVKVRVAATAICHSDVHRLRGDWGGETPIILGHETAGIVEEIGPGVTLAKPGERVVVSLLRSCGRCEFCQTGTPNLCNGDFALNREHRIHDLQGNPIHQGIKVAGFAEYVVVDQSQLAVVPDEMSLDTASLLACGVITGYGAAVNTAQVTSGSVVVVIGTGGVGLNAVQGAAIAGARRVIAIDVLANKLDAACEFGATDPINASQVDAVDAVRQLTGGRMADFVLVTVGSSAAIEQSFTLVRPGGTIVLAGIPALSARVMLDARPFVVSGGRLLGSYMGSTRLQVDMPKLIEHYERGNMLLDELITGRYPLEQINEAIESMERGEALRNVIVFD